MQSYYCLLYPYVLYLYPRIYVGVPPSGALGPSPFRSLAVHRLAVHFTAPRRPADHRRHLAVPHAPRTQPTDAPCACIPPTQGSKACRSTSIAIRQEAEECGRVLNSCALPPARAALLAFSVSGPVTCSTLSFLMERARQHLEPALLLFYGMHADRL